MPRGSRRAHLRAAESVLVPRTHECVRPTRPNYGIGLLARDFLLEHLRTSAARRTSCAISQAAHIELQFRDGPAKGVAMHAQLTRRLALVTVVLLKNVEEEALLEFAHRFRIQDPALVHLIHQRFELVLHGASLSG